MKELFGWLLGVHYWQNGDNYEYCVGVGLGNVGQINGYKIEVAKHKANRAG